MYINLVAPVPTEKFSRLFYEEKRKQKDEQNILLTGGKNHKAIFLQFYSEQLKVK